MSWSPQLDRGTSPLYLAIVQAIERDTEQGVLRPGDRLPPQRALAHRLVIGVGTVTRAYEEAERRGLVTAHVGRGSFIADRAAMAGVDNGEEINLSINQPPFDRATAELATTLRLLGKRGITVEIASYAPPVGTEAARKAAAQWMAWSGRVADADWSRTACTIGAQQAMDQAFAALGAPGEPILCEAVTYWGARALARHRGNPLQGVAMDGEGLLPEALEAAIAQTGSRVLYCTPTLQNPTARVMGARRRMAIAELARKHELWLIEDDVYAHYAVGAGLEPLVNLAPERTIYITSLSKSVLPGLRVGYLLAPNTELFERIAMGLRATNCSPPGLSNSIATEWISEGRAQDIAEAARIEMEARTRFALRALHGLVERPGAPASLHLWLPLDEVVCERIVNRAGAIGLRLLDPSTPRVDASAPHGLRIGIGAPPSLEKLEAGLGRLVEAMVATPPNHDRAVV